MSCWCRCYGATTDHPMELFRMKAAAEDTLRSSGVAMDHRQGHWVPRALPELMRRTAGRSGRPLVFGRGQNPINFVPVADVASAVVTPSSTRPSVQRIVTVAGPRNLTMNELAAMTQRELGTGDQGPPARSPSPRCMSLPPPASSVNSAVVSAGQRRPDHGHHRHDRHGANRADARNRGAANPSPPAL